MSKPGHLHLLEEWMASYRPEELFDQAGRLRAEIAALAPSANRRMSANPHANGGALKRPLRLPDFKLYAVPVVTPGQVDSEATRIMGNFLRDVMQENMSSRNFRIFGPDETASNRLQAVFEATDRAWDAETIPEDDHLAPDGRVMEILSEHTCEGWLEGYLLTGRHGIWEWASNDRGGEPDVVMACAGDVPTLETLAAVDLLHHYAPDIKIRVINVVDLMTLQPQAQHPHGLPDHDFDLLFTKNKPVIFAFHGYPSLIHRLVYKRTNHDNMHVRGYQEEGSTTTPFDMVVRNRLDRFHLVGDVIDRVMTIDTSGVYIKQAIRDKLIEHKRYIGEYGTDLPEVRDWRWSAK